MENTAQATREVTMSELKYTWATLRMRGEWFNGCTEVELRRLTAGRVEHRAGIGWFVPMDCSIFPQPEVA